MECDDSMSRTKAGIVLIVIVSVLVLTPIVLYGTEVDVAQLSFDLSVDSPLPTASLSDLQPLQIPIFTAGLSNVKIDVSSMNPYDYMIARNTARTQVSDDGSDGEGLVEITITFNLTTPSNNSLVFSLTPGTDQGTGPRNIVTLLGPEDGLTTEGEFRLTITITVKVTPPGFSEPVVDILLDPVDLVFTVPNDS